MKKSQIEIINEEDLKNKILVPYLKDLGISVDEIEFETTFKIKLGRSFHIVKNENVRGRSDVLCKTNKQNLFIIEVKNENIDIDKDDIDQGISYARLVHPIAPFVIVTNGKNTIVIDTVTKKNINNTKISTESDFWKNGCTLATKDELEIRYNALQNFIGYSINNLFSFSVSQVADRMQTLKGNLKELHKKYIPELYLGQKDVDEKFTEFIKSSSRCFSIIGESGVGKTNTICALAEANMNNNIVLFLNAGKLTKGIIKSIQEDFNWVFSPNLKSNEILDRLDDLTAQIEGKVCIFIDAIDEATTPKFENDLDDFIRKLKLFNNVKVCVSCKSTEWHRFLVYKGNPTYLSETLYNDSESIHTKASIALKRFVAEEVDLLIHQYQKAFRFKGKISRRIKEECRLGFNLRILSEVYENRTLPDDFKDIVLMKNYLEKKLGKVDSEKCLNYLIEIGKLLIETNTANSNIISNAGAVEESFLRSQLRLSVNEKIEPELFAYNILVRTEMQDGNKYIGFYYTKIRDYVIAILSEQLQNLTDVALKQRMESLMKKNIGQSALSWYYGVASDNHKTIIEETYESRALLFVTEYEKILTDHLYNIKEQFEPQTTGNIGLVMTKPFEEYFTYYGFRQIQAEEDKKIVIIDEPLNSPADFDKAFQKFKVYNIKGRDKSFLTLNPYMAAKEEICNQLENVVRDGRLNEEKNSTLAIEKIIAIIYNYPKELGLSWSPKYRFFPIISPFLPIKLDDILKSIQLAYARRFIKDKIIRDCIQDGQLNVQQKGNFISYSPGELIAKKSDEIEERAQESIRKGEEIQPPNISGEYPPYIVLEKTIKALKAKQKTIKNCLLPEPDLSEDQIDKGKIWETGFPNSISLNFFSRYSDKQLKTFFIKYNNLYFNEYIKLVETCFPTIKDKIPFYASFPLICSIEINTKKPRAWSIYYGYKPNQKKNDVKVEINKEPTIYKSGYKDYPTQSMGTLHGFLSNNKEIPIDKKINTSRTNTMCIIRNNVYDKIYQEIDSIKEAIRNL